jgi:hypothetical protein
VLLFEYVPVAVSGSDCDMETVGLAGVTVMDVSVVAGTLFTLIGT